MPIDPEISLRTIVQKFENPIDNEIKLSQIQLYQQHARKYAADAADEQQLSGAYVVDPTTGEVDVAKTRAKLASVNPRLAMKFDQEQATHQETMLKRSNANEELQRRIAKDKLDAVKKRADAVSNLNRTAVAAAYQAKWQGQDPNQAGQQVYMEGLKQLHQGGILSANATIPAQFDLDHFEKASTQDPQKWIDWSAQQEDGDMQQTADSGGGSMIPAVQTMPAAGQTAIDESGAPQQPQQVTLEAKPGIVGNVGGQLIDVAKKNIPPQAPLGQGGTPPDWNTYNGPDVTGKPKDWARIYAFNGGVMGLKNPHASPTLIDPENGQVVSNEPLLNYRKEVARAGKSDVLVNTGSGSIELGGKSSKTQNDINETLLKNSGRLQRIRSIRDVYNPEFQTIQSQVSMGWAGLKDKFGALGDEDKKKLSSYVIARRRVAEDNNQVIKEMSGSAVSGQEYERMKEQLPIAGTSIGDGDSPTAFISKLDDTHRSIQMAQARLMYLKKNGLPANDESFNKISLESMPGIMQKRAAELTTAAQKANPNMSAIDIKKIIKPQLAQEFGLQ